MVGFLNWQRVQSPAESLWLAVPGNVGFSLRFNQTGVIKWCMLTDTAHGHFRIG